MIRVRARLIALTGVIALLTPQVGRAQPSRMGSPNLSGTSWQLVRFQGADGRVLTPDVRSSYTIAFGTDGRLTARIDCNRGSGTWNSSGGSLTFGPLATTRAQCGRASLYDSIVRNWPYIRSYTIRNGHLYLALQADGGSYEFEPTTGDLSAGSAVRGTATYRDRIILPHTAVFEATIEDVTQGPAQAELIARVRNEQPGGSPIPFVISYDDSRILQNHSYVVRARILVNGSVWFTTDANYPVITAGRVGDVQLIMRRVGSSGATLPGRSEGRPITLENTYWRLISLPNTVVRAANPQQAANFTLHAANKTVTGSGGCNQLSGNYTLNGDRLSLSRVVSTLRACADPIMTNTERVFLKSLGTVTQWRIVAANLELLDASGRVVATLEPVYN
jgi:heat shock protein HslJ